MTMTQLTAHGVSLMFAPECGVISSLIVQDRGRTIDMMHRAPWVGSGDPMLVGTPPHLANLAGDFFCAPFGDASADDNAPLHGWPANSPWTALPSTPSTRSTWRYELAHKVIGATLIKELSLIDDHPFLYQRHIFTGGRGTLSAANHAMISLPNGGLLRFSPKRWFETPTTPLEDDPARGRSCLRYPARSADPQHFPAANGGEVDLTQYPLGPAHEDFVIGLEAPDSPLGWTAVIRPAEGDLYLSLRNPRRLPMMMLWHSNGGRDYAPWLGRHRGCLGVEEGIALPMLGITSREDPDLLSRSGQASALILSPDTQTEVRHVTGCIAWPTAEPVQDVQLSGNELSVLGERGARRTLPFLGDFLSA